MMTAPTPLTNNLPELPPGVLVRMYQIPVEDALAHFRGKYHYNPYKVYTLRGWVFIQPWPPQEVK